ncbi:MAG: cobalamin-binding protein [Spirochaetae bacterium HGW-Spirochaetae-1]|jgi:5-methyltetrahydrofolate--homocysteine methyltransferase|nr:MAG: cobalamin-binding protein [Spirochaetae bacterium HGW-Spirochaetae-1]
MIVQEISEAVGKGKVKLVKELVNQAVVDDIPVQSILNEGLISAMAVVGESFSQHKIFVPEMLVAARAMTAGLAILEPLMSDQGIETIGKVVIGTVRGDLHDIGKNLVAMMLKGAGATVYDLGVDVPDINFIQKAEEVGADIICLSALLTTTMPAIGDVIKEFEKAGVRDKYCIMIGGAPVNQEYADQVKADKYSPDANDASIKAKDYLLSKKK